MSIKSIWACACAIVTGMALTVAAAFATPGEAGAAVIVTDNTTVDSIPAVSTFQTSGADMSGMEVTVTFTAGGTETVTWAPTGASSGAATGTDWSLSLDGDSFATAWQAQFDVAISSMTLDGGPGLTLFDINSLDNPGTPGSALGLPFMSNLLQDSMVIATYSRVVALAGDVPFGDLYHILDVDFSNVENGIGVMGSFAFFQDSDNDIRIQIPEPLTPAILGLGLILLAVMRHRKAGF